MPKTKAKLRRLIDKLNQAEPIEFNIAGRSLAQRLYRYCEDSVCVFGRYDSPEGRLIRSIDSFPAYESGVEGKWRIGNSAFDAATNLLIKVFEGGNSDE